MGARCWAGKLTMRYQISAECAHLERIETLPDGSHRLHRSRILKGCRKGAGYRQIRLPNRKRVGIHALVLETFVGPRPPGMMPCHSDGDPANNRLDNLRWDTMSANMHDAVHHGTHGRARVTQCPSGHEYTEADRRKTRTARRCLKCAAAYSRRQRQQERVAS